MLLDWTRRPVRRDPVLNEQVLRGGKPQRHCLPLDLQGDRLIEWQHFPDDGFGAWLEAFTFKKSQQFRGIPRVLDASDNDPSSGDVSVMGNQAATASSHPGSGFPCGQV
jgi:hypothetical protein